MLRPFLDVAQFWRVPEDARARFLVTHFAQRAEERGVKCLPGWALHWAVVHAFESAQWEILERVFTLKAGAAVWRILLPEGPFYPVITSDGRVVTIYTPDMMRQVRAGRKYHLRHRGRRVPR